MFHVVELDR